MHIILTGLSHKTAPVDIRERCAFSALRLHEVYQSLKASDEIQGVMVLVTCNRTEIYAAVPDVRKGFARLERLLQVCSGLEHAGFAQYLYQYGAHQAIAHLFTVASGLDSMVLGEHQVLGQLKDAYETAVRQQAADSTVHMLLQAALHVGKKVRFQTGINQYPVSISSAAVELCRDIFKTLDDRSVLVVGAGETGELAVRHLLSQGAKTVIVANRSFEHAQRMAAAVNGQAIRFENMPQELLTADIVISCTAAPHFVIRQDNCREQLTKRGGRDLVMIDLAVPRDIEPALGELPHLCLYDIDDLQNVVDTNYKERLRAAHRAREIIEQETTRFSRRLAASSVAPVIKSLRQFAEAVKQEELARALSRLDSPAAHPATVVSALAHTIVSRLLHIPLGKLKEKAARDQGLLYAHIVRDLFDLDLPADQDIQHDHSTTGNKRQ